MSLFLLCAQPVENSTTIAGRVISVHSPASTHPWSGEYPNSFPVYKVHYIPYYHLQTQFSVISNFICYYTFCRKEQGTFIPFRIGDGRLKSLTTDQLQFRSTLLQHHHDSYLHQQQQHLHLTTAILTIRIRPLPSSKATISPHQTACHITTAGAELLFYNYNPLLSNLSSLQKTI